MGATKTKVLSCIQKAFANKNIRSAKNKTRAKCITAKQQQYFKKSQEHIKPILVL